MIAASPPARAWIELGTAAVPVSVLWRETPPATVSVAGQLPGRVIVAGEFVVADASVDDRVRQALADVIVDGGSVPRAVPMRWVSQMLSTFPGCAVTASWCDPDVCAVATRQGMFAISAGGADELGAGFRLFACAAFVHGWLSAQWPMASLRLGSLVIRGSSWPASPSMRGIGDMRIPFMMLSDGYPATGPARRFR
jgi:hypothetical protein